MHECERGRAGVGVQRALVEREAGWEQEELADEQWDLELIRG